MKNPLLKDSSCAGLAHLVEQLICNHQVASSIPAAGTIFFSNLENIAHNTVNHGALLVPFSTEKPPLTSIYNKEGMFSLYFQ